MTCAKLSVAPPTVIAAPLSVAATNESSAVNLSPAASNAARSGTNVLQPTAPTCGEYISMYRLTCTYVQVSLYMEMYSPQVGAVGWSTFVPDLAALEAAGDKLTADDSFVAATDKGAAMTVGGATDSLAQVIYGEPDPSRQIEYVTVVRAICATGSVARGMEAGVELAQRAEKIMSTPSLFLADVTGNFGGVAWASGYENVQALEAGQQALRSEEHTS